MTEILILGVLASIAFYELTDITPGGIIVPGLLVAYISQPLRIVYTVLIAIAAELAVKLLSRKFLIFGKRRFALHIIFSLLIYLIVNLAFGLFVGNFGVLVVSIVGVTAAGIIANNISKQGSVRTVSALAIVTCFIELAVLLLSVAGVIV